jgi:hypothetical protein
MTAPPANDDRWVGGFYELALEYGHAPDERLEAALDALWANSTLSGWHAAHATTSPPPGTLYPKLTTLRSGTHFHGVARLPKGKQVDCGICLIQETGGSNWIDFYLPLGGLSAAYDVGAFPFDRRTPSQEWREPVESWLAEVGRAVFQAAPFRLGLIGFEVSGDTTADELMKTGVPGERAFGYLWPADQPLTWYPTNQWQTPIRLGS